MNQQNFVIVDPVMPTNNTARNSYRTTDILNCFRTTFKSLKEFVRKMYLDCQELERQKAASSADQKPSEDVVDLSQKKGKPAVVIS